MTRSRPSVSPYGGRADGHPQGRTVSFAFADVAATTTVTSFTYDGQVRLLAATVQGTDIGSESVDEH